MNKLSFLTMLAVPVAIGLCVYPLASEARTKPSQSDTQPTTQVVIRAPGYNKAITYIGEPRLSQLTEQLRWQNVYWPSARLCTPALQQKLNARRAGIIAQLQLLSSVYRHDGDDTLAIATQALIEQVKRWPLHAHFAERRQHGIDAASLIVSVQKNWLLQREQQPYTLTVADQPQNIHWVGLTTQAGSYAYSHQQLSDWLARRESAQITDPEFIWEVTLDGTINRVGLYPHNSNDEFLQPGAVLFSGFEPSDLPDGFQQTNAELVDLLRYWQPGQSLNEQPQESATCD